MEHYGSERRAVVLNAIAKNTLNSADCLKALTDFCQVETRIEKTSNGLAAALPMLYPDGWQVIIEFQKGATVTGEVESAIHIDYLIRKRSGMAIEVVKRHRDILPYMEQWGGRWNDIKKANPHMIRAMIYDPDQQEWNDTALRIGRTVCDLFCPYSESDTLDAALKKVA